MSVLIVHNIGHLYGVRTDSAPLKGEALAQLPAVGNAWLRVDGDRIAAHGSGPAPEREERSWRYVDAGGVTVLPAWCDAHTHLVYADTREGEFVDRIRGFSYEDIAARGGGILNSAGRVRETSEEVLYRQALARAGEWMRLGTGALEIKSGYGLTLEAELKMLRVIRKLRDTLPIHVKATFLGAHAYPPEYRENKARFVDVLVDEWIPKVAEAGLADFIDVFCEEGFFDPASAERICEAGRRYGLKPKVHANQLHRSGGVQAGVRAGALSVDHLENIGPEEIGCLRGAHTIPVLLPGSAFFLGLPQAPARELIGAGLPVALASDCNPGSCPSGNMNFVVSLACLQMHLLPEEAVNAATLNAAHAMDLGHEVGSVSPGKLANLIFLKPNLSLHYLPYAFGSNSIGRVMLAGAFLDELRDV